MPACCIWKHSMSCCRLEHTKGPCQRTSSLVILPVKTIIRKPCPPAVTVARVAPEVVSKRRICCCLKARPPSSVPLPAKQ